MTAEKQYGWGLIGPGRFAKQFAGELREVDRARLVAVASRSSEEKAAEFAAEFGFERSYGSYAALLADDDVDIVYVVVPHPFHREVSEMALAAGKGVVCEKPLTPTADETRALVAFARDSGQFLMEAMKTRFLPAIIAAKKWIDEGKIGDVVLSRADFCFRGPGDPNDRLMNPALAGGAVLDVGIYPIFLTRYLLGEVDSVQAVGTLASTGVESSASILTRHQNGATSAMTCSFCSDIAMSATISGTEGTIFLPKFHAETRIELRKQGDVVEVFEDNAPSIVKGEIHAAMAALDEELTECPGHTLDDTIRLAEIMDEVRRQVGTL